VSCVVEEMVCQDSGLVMNISSRDAVADDDAFWYSIIGMLHRGSELPVLLTSKVFAFSALFFIPLGLIDIKLTT
jgi:hypothetical protein